MSSISSDRQHVINKMYRVFFPFVEMYIRKTCSTFEHLKPPGAASTVQTSVRTIATVWLLENIRWLKMNSKENNKDSFIKVLSTGNEVYSHVVYTDTPFPRVYIDSIHRPHQAPKRLSPAGYWLCQLYYLHVCVCNLTTTIAPQ